MQSNWKSTEEGLYYDAAVSQFESAVKEITEAVLQPRPMTQ